ncbi:hypothetical protein SDC9_95117 [bioreactor metagenome]|uniref:Uncharacterized protein n=1 Tax=bioreactor metagenome TaxID=1076179 RepID=A0A645A5N5_9ZZZZ
MDGERSTDGGCQSWFGGTGSADVHHAHEDGLEGSSDQQAGLNIAERQPDQRADDDRAVQHGETE